MSDNVKPTDSAQAPDGGTPKPGAPASTDTAPVENWEKRFKDTQAEYTRIAQERAEMAKELAVARAIADERAKSSAPSSPTPEQMAAHRSAIAKRLQEGGEEAVIDYFDELAIRMRDAVKAEHLEEIKRRDERIDKLNSEFERMRLSLDPVYQANREKVEELKQLGMSEAHAVAAVKKLVPAIPPGATPPVGTSSRRTTDDDDSRRASDADVSAFVEAMGGVDKVSQAEIDNFRKRFRK